MSSQGIKCVVLTKRAVLQQKRECYISNDLVQQNLSVHSTNSSSKEICFKTLVSILLAGFSVMRKIQDDIVTLEFMDQMYSEFTHCHYEFNIHDKHSG